MNTDSSGLLFIEQQEGFSPTVTGDTGGKQEVGYGHDLLPGESFPSGISQDDAVQLLSQDVSKCDRAIAALGWDLNQNQWNALADFAYECGIGALRQLAAHGMDQVTSQLPRWSHASVNGVMTVMPGMVRRRLAEVELWQSAPVTIQ